MENLPLYIPLFFVLTTFVTVFFFYKSAHSSKISLLVVLIWLFATSLLALNGFFTVTDTLPPRFILLVGPPLLLIAVLFFSHAGRHYVNQLDLKTLTLLHIVRIPVELILYWLAQHKSIPELMTFEGSNFDILSGLSAPLVFYFGFVKKSINSKILLLWNVACLLLLFNIVIRAILATPSPFQQLAFEQPNKAIMYFPYVWLPGCIVPLVLLSHLVAFKKLLLTGKTTTTNSVLPNPV